ncbi:hypothetical protein U91I_00440 [alpha proteobacterium U9-1i]|nr:hypothetical protein U91I_00440 [alpha proteobacterium U9-1i]
MAAALAVASLTTSTPAQAAEASGWRNVGQLQISSGPANGVSTFYISSDTGWGASSCPSATWAYFYSDRLNARDMYALVLWAKQMNKQVLVYGDCVSGGYMQIIQVNVYP